jgi:hypothetical protein cdivTM7_00062
MKTSAKIKPNSRHREEVVANDDGSLIICTKAPAIKGRANLAAVKLVAKYYGVAPSRVRLVRGAASRNKVFEIADKSPDLLR